MKQFGSTLLRTDINARNYGLRTEGAFRDLEDCLCRDYGARLGFPNVPVIQLNPGTDGERLCLLEQV